MKDFKYAVCPRDLIKLKQELLSIVEAIEQEKFVANVIEHSIIVNKEDFVRKTLSLDYYVVEETSDD